MKRTRILVFLLAFLMCGVNVIWADEEEQELELSSTITTYMASLKAQKSPSSAGDGLVRLTWLDITGKPFVNPIGVGENGLNASNPVPYAETAQMLGATMIAIDGMETPVEIGGEGSQIYMTSMLYFHPEAQPVAGSYLADWTFGGDDAAFITRVSEPMGGYADYGDEYYDNDLEEWVRPVIAEYPLRSPCFKLLPDKENSGTLTEYIWGEQVEEEWVEHRDYIPDVAFQTACYNVMVNPNNIYAVFNQYLLYNPSVNSGKLEAAEDEYATLDLYFYVNGDVTQYKDNYGDFDFPSYPTSVCQTMSIPETPFAEDENGAWTWDFAEDPVTFVDGMTARAHVKVKYTAKSGITAGIHTTTITVKMMGENPSTLNIPLSVEALDPNRPEALLFDGQTQMEMEKTTLAELLAVDVSSYANPILKLNKDWEDNLLIMGKKFTLDLNGNDITGCLTVYDSNDADAEVTIAYSKFGGEISELKVDYGGKVILNGGTIGTLTIDNHDNGGTVEQNGATITGDATNAGTLTTTEGIFQSGLSSSGTLMLNGGTFNGATAVTVSGGTADIKRGTLYGTDCGLLVSGGTATVRKLAVITSDGDYSANRTAGTLNIESGKFGKPLHGDVAFTAGFFKENNYGVSTEDKTELRLAAGVEYIEGYRYFLGNAESALANGVGVCRIGSTSYARLEDALAYANNNPNEANIVIFMTNDYILPAGNYTLPANATIVVPMSDTQEKEINKTAPRIVFNDQTRETPYSTIMPTEFRRLTFASGVNMEVFGEIELSGTQYASNEAYTSQPCGAYGRLVMEEGSHMTLQNGSELRAWGFMTGKGETDARRGATVREMFQMGDWKGAMTSVKITGMVPESSPAYSIVGGDDSDKKIFPVTQYFIQNVECPVKYHPGAVLSTSATVSEGFLGMSVAMAATDIAVIGLNETHQAIFLMEREADAENTWVRKWYDTENDVQVYEINSGAHIGSLVLDMGDISLLTYGTVPIRLNSAKFDLPLTSNFKIHLLSGTMDFKQNTSLLPGAVVEVDKESVVGIEMDDDEKASVAAWRTAHAAWEENPEGDEPEAPVTYTGALYVYDAADWDKYAYCNEIDADGNSHKGTAYTKTVRYAPSANNGEGGRPDVRNEQTLPASAAINVHGTFRTASGFVYCSNGGANIFSSNEDAGTFIFEESAAEAGERTVWQVKNSGTFESRTFYPAKLRNGVEDPAFANTADAEEGDAYCFTDYKWNTMKVDEDNDCFVVDDYDMYYAKPQEYVALANGMTPNGDHTFSDAAGAGRLFILMDLGCQWWEVEKKDNLYHCIHPENDTYYYWDDSDPNPVFHEWKEKRFTITWKNWDGSPVYTANSDGDETDTYEVPYGTQAEFLGTNPTREKNIDYTYDFTGWNPALGKVTSDVTYTATYEQKPRMYTIIFQQEGGLEIERQFLTHNEVPVCENTPTKIGHTLVWSPAIAAVTGDAVYRATWLENPPTEYEVTFFDYDGETVLKQDNVQVGETPTAPVFADGKWNDDEDLTGKPATSEFTYVFDHWSPEIEAVSATSVKSYTAIYREVAQTYSVIFQNENGSEIERHEYQYGETPVCSATPTKANTAEWSYGFAWNPQIQTVQGNATYQATFPATKNMYTVKLSSNLDAVCRFTGAGIYPYGTHVDISVEVLDEDNYEFGGWLEIPDAEALIEDVEITGDITLTAMIYSLNSSGDLEIGWDIINADEVRDEWGELEHTNLYISSNGLSASGQFIGDIESLSFDGEACFDLSPDGGFAAHTWYAVAVPWQINVPMDAFGGVCAVDGESNETSLMMNQDYDLLYYDGASRAANGPSKDNWKLLADQAANQQKMKPGTLYMIYLANAAPTLRFKKENRQPLVNYQLNVQAYPTNTGNDVDANWNGIANPALYHAYLNAGSAGSVGQQYVNGAYMPIVLNEGRLVLGEAVFVQAPSAKTVVADNSAYGAAPRRERVGAPIRFDVRIATEDAAYSDRLFIQVDDDKEENKYIIGQDLAKMGVSSKVAQLWINRYNTKLCVNTMALENETAEYPLGIYAPAAGDYTISNIQSTMSNEDYDLYLTRNGEAIWNLSDGAYTMNLERGTHSNYGLRVSARAPQSATGVDEAIVDAQGETRKVLMNNQVYIIRGNEVYTITGQKVQ